MSSSKVHSYESRWDYTAATTREAMLAVDGSGNEEILARSGRWTARQVMAALDLQPGDKVLELGCGVGRIGRELLPHCAEWHGADISTNMLKVAGERLADFPNAHLHKLDRTCLSIFEDHCFDKAYCVAVLIHVDKEDVFLYLRELARVLKPGGILYVETWNLASRVGWERWMLEVNQWDRSDQRGRKDVSRNQFCHPAEFGLYLKQAGLSEVTMFDRSAWLQAIAVKSDDPAEIERQRTRVARLSDQIAYSENWDRLFGLIVDILAGRRDIHQVIAELENAPDEETQLICEHLKAQI